MKVELFDKKKLEKIKERNGFEIPASARFCNLLESNKNNRFCANLPS